MLSLGTVTPLRRVRGAVRWGARLWEWEERRFDRKLGVDTDGWIELDSLTIPMGDPAKGIHYGPTPVLVVRWWLRELSVDARGFTFVDMGSGKGRVPLCAALHGFRRSIGVEFAEELHRVAQKNARAARTHGLTVEPILGDAAAFDFPSDPLVVFFNNPFTESVMESVLANLAISYGNRPRPIVVVYQQWHVQPSRTRTRNIELLEQVPFLTCRKLVPRRFIDRKLLQGYVVQIFESREVWRPEAFPKQSPRVLRGDARNRQPRGANLNPARSR